MKRLFSHKIQLQVDYVFQCDRSIKLLKNNLKEYLQGHEVGEELLHRTQRLLTMKEKANISDLQCNSQRCDMEQKEKENIFSECAADVGLSGRRSCSC